MLDEATLPQAELYFQLYLHILVPLHRSLVSAMMRSAAPPLELATTLEDIGQDYVGMANALNGELIDRGCLGAEPDPDDYAEARIAGFVDDLLRRAGHLEFADGVRLDAAQAFGGLPLIRNALTVALLMGRATATRTAR